MVREIISFMLARLGVLVPELQELKFVYLLNDVLVDDNNVYGGLHDQIDRAGYLRILNPLRTGFVDSKQKTSSCETEMLVDTSLRFVCFGFGMNRYLLVQKLLGAFMELHKELRAYRSIWNESQIELEVGVIFTEQVEVIDAEDYNNFHQQDGLISVAFDMDLRYKWHYDPKCLNINICTNVATPIV